MSRKSCFQPSKYACILKVFLLWGLDRSSNPYALKFMYRDSVRIWADSVRPLTICSSSVPLCHGVQLTPFHSISLQTEDILESFGSCILSQSFTRVSLNCAFPFSQDLCSSSPAGTSSAAFLRTMTFPSALRNLP